LEQYIFFQVALQSLLLAKARLFVSSSSTVHDQLPATLPSPRLLHPRGRGRGRGSPSIGLQTEVGVHRNVWRRWRFLRNASKAEIERPEPTQSRFQSLIASAEAVTSGSLAIWVA
jgi:hypothetical protein